MLFLLGVTALRRPLIYSGTQKRDQRLTIHEPDATIIINSHDSQDEGFEMCWRGGGRGEGEGGGGVGFGVFRGFRGLQLSKKCSKALS